MPLKRITLGNNSIQSIEVISSQEKCLLKCLCLCFLKERVKIPVIRASHLDIYTFLDCLLIGFGHIIGLSQQFVRQYKGGFNYETSGQISSLCLRVGSSGLVLS